MCRGCALISPLDRAADGSRLYTYITYCDPCVMGAGCSRGEPEMVGTGAERTGRSRNDTCQEGVAVVGAGWRERWAAWGCSAYIGMLKGCSASNTSEV